MTEQALTLEIIVSDNGDPAERSSIQVPVQVKTDVANFTRFVGFLAAADADSEMNEAWLFDRWNKQELFVREGEKLNVADISARLVKVEFNKLTFERDGENVGAGSRPRPQRNPPRRTGWNRPNSKKLGTGQPHEMSGA